MESDDEQDEIAQTLNDVNSTPVGSHFGEQGERLRSARIRSASAVSRKNHMVNHSNETKSVDMNQNASETDRKASEMITKEEEQEAEKHIIDDDGDGEEGKEDIW